MTSATVRAVEVTWRPTLRYYQHRLDPLETLERDERLESFRVDEHEVSARTAGVELRLGSTGVYVHALATVENAQVLDLIRLVLEAVDPTGFDHLHGIYWHVLPLDEEDYDQGRIRVLDRWSGGVLTGAGGHDFSILMDGESGGFHWQCEFGIVTADEAVARIAGRRKGQLPVSRDGDGLSVDPTTLPPIGLFAQSLWHGAFPTKDSDRDGWLQETLNRIDVEAEKLVGQVHSYIIGSSSSSLSVAEGGEG